MVFSCEATLEAMNVRPSVRTSVRPSDTIFSKMYEFTGAYQKGKITSPGESKRLPMTKPDPTINLQSILTTKCQEPCPPRIQELLPPGFLSVEMKEITINETLDLI